MTDLLIIIGVAVGYLGAVAVLMSAGYLCACAGAGRWLTLREWL